jgi:hypothetical protein
MTEADIIPLVTGPLGAIAIGWFWNRQLVKDHAEDKKAWRDQLEEKDDRIKELTDQNQKIGVEAVGAIGRVMDSLNRLTPCKFTHDSKSS